ncbi:MAG: ribosomal protein S18-alanine N-acetyltransferase [Aquificae bacterium]|nr:ribosomal protein S18-alanine N-acetyltransferase [Aquificota bacterium]
MALKVRLMTEEDLPAVHRINLESFASDAWSLSSVRKELEHRFSRPFVLEEDGKVVGYAFFWVVGDEATLLSFAVERSKRGRGYGTFLIKESIRRLSGVKRVLLDVRKSNLPAINLYRKLGFKTVKERPSYYSDGENALLMELKL